MRAFRHRLLPCLAVSLGLSLILVPGALGAASVPVVGPRTLRVGKGLEFTTVAAAAAAARDGDVVEIEAGDYWRDAALWPQKRLTIRGVHGKVRMMAGGSSAQGKAIWVFPDGDFLVENVEFHGARVPDKNGAGIRFEKGRLRVRNCVFSDNEDGLMTANFGDAELTVENSEFGYNGSGDGYTHNIYVGSIRRLVFVGNYSHHVLVGHLLKSRAQENYVLYNRLTDETGGSASYEMEFPSGGLAYVIGNIVEQGSGTQNPHLLSFGTEGYAWPRNELYLVNNTLVDDRPKGGVFLKLRPGAQVVRAVNNLLIGSGDLETGERKERLLAWAKGIRAEFLGEAAAPVAAGASSYGNNLHAEWGDVEMEARQDYRLKAKSELNGKGVEPGSANGISLHPTREYVHPHATRMLPPGLALSPGAFQVPGP